MDAVLRIATSERIMAGHDPEFGLRAALKETVRTLKADWGGIWLVDGGKRPMHSAGWPG